MESIQKRLDYLTQQVKDLQDKDCNCCEGDGECNCQEEIKELLNLIQELSAAQQECCNSTSQEISKLEKELENQRQSYLQLEARVTALEGN